MDSQSDPPSGALTPDTLVLLNRATLVMHTVRTAIHEVNNVLQMISSSAEMLSGSPDSRSEAAARVDAILQSTLRGHAILQNVSDLARRDRSGERALDVSKLAEQALAMRRYEHNRSGIRARIEQCGQGSGRVRMDPQHLLQILLNLVINAEQAVAGRPTRELRVSITANHDDVEICVSDSGPGVSDSVRLFELPAPSGPQGSPGLGLAACRVILAQYGGSLDLGKAPSGAAFVVRLPAVSG